MGTVYYVNETKTERLKRLAEEKYSQAKAYVTEHWGEILEAGVVISGSAVAVGGIIKAIKPSAIDRHDKKVDRTYYDPSTGIHWELRRKATNNDRMALVRRRRNGEQTEDILRDLRLI